MKKFLWILVFALILAGCQAKQPTPEQGISSETEEKVTAAPTTEAHTQVTTEAPTTEPPVTETPTTVEPTTREYIPYETNAPDFAKISLDFDKVAAKGTMLDENEMKEIEGFFQKDQSQYPWYFLRQSYHDASEINILLLFDSGTDNEIPQEECEAAWAASGAYGFGPQKRTIKSVQDLFMKYTGKDLTEDQMKLFYESTEWLYLQKYDAYYSFGTDAPDDLRTHTLGRGCRLGRASAETLGIPAEAEEMIAVEWAGGGIASPEVAGMVILIPEGDTYRIAANLLFE